MSRHDVIDEFEALVRELRAGQPAAPAELRMRVRAIAAREPKPAARPRLTWRRAALVLAAAAAAAVGAAAGVGLLSSGSGGDRSGAPTVGEAAKAPAPVQGPARAQADRAAPLPVAGRRARRVEVELALRVRDLSAATKRALRLTRAFGGYVRSVDYGSGARSGQAHLVVRVPTGRVQQAIVRFTALGRILAQRVSVRDVQSGLDRRFRRMQAVRREIAVLRKRLSTDFLDAETKARLEAKLTRARRELVALQREQARAWRQASFATVSLSLTTRERAAALPARPGRLERALERAGSILVGELVVLLHAAIVAGPLVLLAATGLTGRRALRRRERERLLGQA